MTRWAGRAQFGLDAREARRDIVMSPKDLGQIEALRPEILKRMLQDGEWAR